MHRNKSESCTQTCSGRCVSETKSSVELVYRFWPKHIASYLDFYSSGHPEFASRYNCNTKTYGLRLSWHASARARTLLWTHMYFELEAIFVNWMTVISQVILQTYPAFRLQQPAICTCLGLYGPNTQFCNSCCTCCCNHLTCNRS